MDAKFDPAIRAIKSGDLNGLRALLDQASLHNLRIAAGLGRTDLIESLFNTDGTLKPEAGKIDGTFSELQKSNLNCQIQDELQAKVAQWSDDPQDIINNAFIYACMHITSRPRACYWKRGRRSTLSHPALITLAPVSIMRRSTVIEEWLSSWSNRALT